MKFKSLIVGVMFSMSVLAGWAQTAQGFSLEGIRDRTRLLAEPGDFPAAVKKGAPAVRRLLNNGTAIDDTDSLGRTLLHFAAGANKPYIVRILLKKERDVQGVTLLHVGDTAGRTPLYYAVRYRSKEAATVLLKRGANPSAQDIYDDTPLHWAIHDGDSATLALLLKHGDGDQNFNVDVQDAGFKYTPLHEAVQRESLAVVRLLLKYDADPDAQDHVKWTPLHHAVNEEKVDFVRILVKFGADVNAKSKSKYTPLDLALPAPDDDKIVKILKDAGALTNKYDPDRGEEGDSDD